MASTHSCAARRARAGGVLRMVLPLSELRLLGLLQCGEAYHPEHSREVSIAGPAYTTTTRASLL